MNQSSHWHQSTLSKAKTSSTLGVCVTGFNFPNGTHICRCCVSTAMQSAISDEKCLRPLSLFLNMFVCVQYIMGWFQIKINTFSKTSSPMTTLTTSYDDVFALNTSGI